MGFFNKLKEQAFEKAKEEMMQQMGLDLDAIAGIAGGVGGNGSKNGKMTQEEYEATKPDEMRKDIRMISGCDDHQTSADVSNVASFQLPDPAGMSINCTRLLLWYERKFLTITTLRHYKTPRESWRSLHFHYS